MKTKIRDFFRGYSNKDLETAREKIAAESRLGAWTELTKKELKAIRANPIPQDISGFMKPRWDAEKESCRNCRFGGVYHCCRHAPVHFEGQMDAVFPSIYNNGCGMWCGDWEAKDEGETK